MAQYGAVGGLIQTPLRVQSFNSAEDFLNQVNRETPGCLVLDVRMPGMSGLELQSQLAARDFTMPIVFITAHDNMQIRLQAMQAGAVAFLLKPFDDRALLDAVYTGLGRS